MKFISSIVLLLFVLFLVAPTIVLCIEKDKDKSSLSSNNTTSSSFEELKHDIKYCTLNYLLEISFLNVKKDTGLIIFENLSKHDLISASIFIPPPNTIS